MLDKFKFLNLSNYPHQAIKDLIKSLPMNGFLFWTMPLDNNILIRARLHDDLNERFYSKCQLTYAPPHLNKKYGRASTPNNAMFYGVWGVQPSKFNDLREVPLIECHPWLRDVSTKGLKKVTFGKWRFHKEMKVAVIIPYKDFINNPNNNSFLNSFIELLGNHPQKEDSLEITKFLASEYAKVDTGNDYDYLISAIFSDEYIEYGVDGILYPSTRVIGDVFNIAIKPQFVDLFLHLEMVTECSVYKLYERCELDNDFKANLYINQTHFELKPVDKNEHGGLDFMLNKLGLNSIDDLNN